MMKTDEQTISHLDFEFAPPCEVKFGQRVGIFGETYPGQPCGNVAEYKLIRNYCCDEKPDAVVLICQRCLNDKMSCVGVRCPYCLMRWMPPITAWKAIIKL